MKTFEDFNYTEREIEKTFLELSHIDELEINFDFIRYTFDLYYFYKNECLFEYDKISDFFYVNYYRVWLPIRDFDHDDLEEFMVTIIVKYFNIDVKSVRPATSIIPILNDHFKNNT